MSSVNITISFKTMQNYFKKMFKCLIIFLINSYFLVISLMKEYSYLLALFFINLDTLSMAKA